MTTIPQPTDIDNLPAIPQKWLVEYVKRLQSEAAELGPCRRSDAIVDRYQYVLQAVNDFNETREEIPTPCWRPSPTCPGTWYVLDDGVIRGSCRLKTVYYRGAMVTMTQEDLDRGAPFNSRGVYGPIPTPPTALCDP